MAVLRTTPEELRAALARNKRARAAQGGEWAGERDASGCPPLVIQPSPSFSHWTRPSAPARPLLPLHSTEIGKPTPTTPQTPPPPRSRAPLVTWEPFVGLHRARDTVRHDYLQPEYRNRPSLDRATRDDLNGRSALFLPANNMPARIRYARITAEHLSRFTDDLPSQQPIFFVTLIRRDHAVPLDEAAAFDTARVTGWTHHVLRGAHYVGMVEGAYHTTLAQFGVAGRIAISWHSHAVLWGLNEADLAARIKDANGRYHALIPELDPAHYRLLEHDEVFGQGLYMSKGQINEYRAWPRMATAFDERTGTFVKVFTGRYTLKKRDLRARDAVHACRAFADRTINSLAFAAGDGRGILNSIHHESLADFRRWEAGQSYMRRPAGRS